MASMRFF